MSLKGFFKENAIKKDDEREIIVSDRFKDEDGNPIPWKIRALPPKKFTKITQEAVTFDKNGNPMYKNGMDPNTELIVSCVIDPNLRDVELQDSYGVQSAGDLLDEMLLSSEYMLLFTEINQMHMPKKLDEMVDNVKNS